MLNGMYDDEIIIGKLVYSDYSKMLDTICDVRIVKVDPKIADMMDEVAKYATTNIRATMQEARMAAFLGRCDIDDIKEVKSLSCNLYAILTERKVKEDDDDSDG